MIAVMWQDFKGLVWYPSETLECIVARHSTLASLGLGTTGYYVSTLQLSELLFPSFLGETSYFLLNFPVACGRMTCVILLVHAVCRVVGHSRAGWWDLLSLWAYTQVPAIMLTTAGIAFLAAPRLASKAGVEMEIL